VTGCDNEFSNNVANGASFPKDCKVVDKGGNVYRGLGPGDTDLPNPNQPKYPGYYHENSGQSVPVQVYGNSNGPPPKCSCSCSY
jgi:hypothetical protein